MQSSARQSTGIPSLDQKLGGGLLPGTLTVVVGATGIGKTQLGIQFAHAGGPQEDHPGVFFDLSARGDSQNHADYAKRIFDWHLSSADSSTHVELDGFYEDQRSRGDYLHVFDHQGRRVTKRDLDWDDWKNWQSELNAKLLTSIGFLYGNFIQGSRRVVIDGVEPSDQPNESIQLNLFEYLYHQVIRKDSEWVARDLFRQRYREHAALATANAYPASSIGAMLLYTSHESLLDEMIVRPLDEGDALANANTLIYMGKIREGNHLSRGIYIAKHRGSACSDEIIPYTIDDGGIVIKEQ